MSNAAIDIDIDWFYFSDTGVTRLVAMSSDQYYV